MLVKTQITVKADTKTSVEESETGKRSHLEDMDGLSRTWSCSNLDLRQDFNIGQSQVHGEKRKMKNACESKCGSTLNQRIPS